MITQSLPLDTGNILLATIHKSLISKHNLKRTIYSRFFFCRSTVGQIVDNRWSQLLTKSYCQPFIRFENFRHVFNLNKCTQQIFQRNIFQDAVTETIELQYRSIGLSDVGFECFIRRFQPEFWYRAVCNDK